MVCPHHPTGMHAAEMMKNDDVAHTPVKVK
jgi:hypothetical protein